MFSGYLNLDNGNHLHYVFLYSQRAWNSDPLLIWFNGGPGCSSLDGLLYEHGPFLVEGDGKSFTENPDAWNTVANVLYIEAPAGVGFSYSDSGTYSSNDDLTATDNADAIEVFLTMFPEFTKHDVFLSGESYAGVYVPTLALEIMQRGKKTPINLKGIAIGNGLSSYTLNDNSLMFFAYHHGLLADSLWGSMTTSCCRGAVDANSCNFHNNVALGCMSYVGEAFEIIYSSGLNFYNLYGNCLNSAGSEKYQRDLDSLYRRIPLLSSVRREYKLRSTRSSSVVPCIDSRGATLWLNKPEVMKALHVKMDVGKWKICSSHISYSRTYDTMKPIYEELFNKYKLPALSYNGDTDMACNFLGNEWFVNSLNRPKLKEWQTWSLPGSSQVDGFLMEFDLLKFYTIKGAGHMVPQWRPKQALFILVDFLYQNNKGKKEKLLKEIFTRRQFGLVMGDRLRNQYGYSYQ